MRPTSACEERPNSRPAVLVTDAHTIAAIGVIRALGRAGYAVHACAHESDALGLRSRYASQATPCPPCDHPRFVAWLRSYARLHDIRLIIPSEAVLLGLRPVFDEFAPLLAYGARPETVYAALSKCTVYRALRDSASAGDHLPPTICLATDDPAPADALLTAWGAPLFVKVDAAQARGHQGSATCRLESTAAAQALLVRWRRVYDQVLVQGHTPGVGVGAFFLIHRGAVLAEFMHRRLHEVPHTGGVSALRESWRHEAIRDDALAKLRALDWEGVAMMEYRWDPTSGRFHFIEMNPRYWGSLHLALRAGVDFPRLQADAFFGQPSAPVRTYPLGVRCRHTFPKDLQHVWSRWCDRDLPLGARLGSVAEFAALSLNPRVGSDLWFPGDHGLYGQSVLRMVRDIASTVRDRLTPRRRHTAPMGMIRHKA